MSEYVGRYENSAFDRDSMEPKAADGLLQMSQWEEVAGSAVDGEGDKCNFPPSITLQARHLMGKKSRTPSKGTRVVETE